MSETKRADAFVDPKKTPDQWLCFCFVRVWLWKFFWDFFTSSLELTVSLAMSTTRSWSLFSPSLSCKRVGRERKKENMEIKFEIINNHKNQNYSTIEIFANWFLSCFMNYWSAKPTMIKTYNFFNFDFFLIRNFEFFKLFERFLQQTQIN